LGHGPSLVVGVELEGKDSFVDDGFSGVHLDFGSEGAKITGAVGLACGVGVLVHVPVDDQVDEGVDCGDLVTNHPDHHVDVGGDSSKREELEEESNAIHDEITVQEGHVVVLPKSVLRGSRRASLVEIGI